MPLDDTYIHFQYARQLASGQPYIYNPGQPPTSGATSFLYPFILAIGYLLGFQGLNLGLWALLVGMAALGGSAWLVYQLGKAHDASDLLAVLVAVVFILSGPVSWHFMSGMETGLAMLFMLATLYMVVASRLQGFVVAATFLALVRPEGGILAVLAAAIMGVQLRHKLKRRDLLWLLVPVLAVGIQPLVNLVFTGSAIATGNQAKSLLSLIPPDKDVVLGRITDNFVRMWRELLVPGDLFEPGTAGIAGIGLVAVIGLGSLLLKRGSRLVGLLLVLWFLAGTTAISTLDTAFWHFKRYQMPLAVLCYPLAIVGVSAMIAWIGRVWKAVRAPLGLNELRFAIAIVSAGFWVFALVSIVFSVPTSWDYWKYYFLNADSVYLQPLQMARWLAANTPPDATIAVHDVGMMRYVGGRTTLDMVGLTTAGAAEAWRNGPGAVAQFLERLRPDYVAAYTDARGLSYLADTGIYGEQLASYTVDYEESSNVALAGHFQGIYRTDWSDTAHANEVLQPSVLNYLTDFERVDSLDVADLQSEQAHDYRWSDSQQLPGFPTEVYEQSYLSCGLADCRVLDGGRRINGEETFTLKTHPNEDLILVTRLQPINTGTFDVYAGDTKVATRWIPAIPGQWLEVPTLVPRRYVTSNTLDVRIVPHTPGGHYMPYHHWAFQGQYPTPSTASNVVASFQQGRIGLADEDSVYKSRKLMVTLDWQTLGEAQGDYRVFLHVYNNIDEPPVAQLDRRPGDGTLPPGNWLPGVFRDTMEVDLSSLPAGAYRLAVGMYDPLTNERLMPETNDSSYEIKDGRLFLGEVDVK
jgi:hypothetical protein